VKYLWGLDFNGHVSEAGVIQEIPLSGFPKQRKKP